MAQKGNKLETEWLTQVIGFLPWTFHPTSTIQLAFSLFQLFASSITLLSSLMNRKTPMGEIRWPLPAWKREEWSLVTIGSCAGDWACGQGLYNYIRDTIWNIIMELNYIDNRIKLLQIDLLILFSKVLYYYNKNKSMICIGWRSHIQSRILYALRLSYFQ